MGRGSGWTRLGRVRRCMPGLALLSALAGVGGAVPAGAADYLSSELRARVDKLQADVAATPTSPANAASRAEVLWAWANAFALAGGYVPVNLTAAIRPGVLSAAGAAAATDAYVRELGLIDADPKALGELRADAGPFEAASRATFQQVYRVGTRPIRRGGGIVVARHFMADHGAFQTADPAADNHVSVQSSNAEVRFVAETVPVVGMHGGFRGAAPALYFRVANGELRTGDVVTITYGDRSGGGGGLVMPTISSDRMPFPLYVILDDSGEQYSLPIQAIRIVGTRVAGVHGFAPSVVRPGETFSLSVRAEDAFYNRAAPPIPAWQVYANGELLREVPAGDDAIVVLDDLSFDAPGVYRISIRAASGDIAGVANPILVATDASRVFWGDTHGHSGFAEGIGTPDRFMTWARDDARLDFVTHSEHDIWMDDFEWQVLKDNVASFSEEGRFVAYLGYEWTTANVFGGHHNVLFRTPEDRERIATQFYPTLSRLYAGLRAKHDPRDVVVIPHAHQAGDYRMSDPELEPLVEIMSQHGTFEWFGRMYLGHGHQVGFTAASDNHLSQPGYTAPIGGGLAQRGGLGAVIAETATRDAIFDAMKALRTYATTGERMILDVELNGVGMGQRAPFAQARQIEGRVIGTAPIETITVVKNDQVLWSRDYLAVDSDRFKKAETFLLSFQSESMPMQRGDNPRGWRPWRGRVEVVGATLVAAVPTDFVNRDSQRLEINPSDGNQFTFATHTRGDASSIRLDLRDVRDATIIRITLESGQEFGGAPPTYRQHANVAGAVIELRAADLRRGSLERRLPIDIYQDTVTLRRRVPQGSDDIRFSVRDESALQGDFYFVRVKQIDDAMAWSSPIWVGGHPSR